MSLIHFYNVLLHFPNNPVFFYISVRRWHFLLFKRIKLFVTFLFDILFSFHFYYASNDGGNITTEKNDKTREKRFDKNT